MSEKSTGKDEASDETGGTSLGEERTELAYERSNEAAERTLMAAVRTAVAMISFGFTIAKIFESLDELGVAHSKQAEINQLPFPFGLILLAGGTLTIGFGLFEYFAYAHAKKKMQGEKIRMNTALFSSIFVLVVGLFLTMIVVIKIIPDT